MVSRFVSFYTTETPRFRSIAFVSAWSRYRRGDNKNIYLLFFTGLSGDNHCLGCQKSFNRIGLMNGCYCELGNICHISFWRRGYFGTSSSYQITLTLIHRNNTWEIPCCCWYSLRSKLVFTHTCTDATILALIYKSIALYFEIVCAGSIVPQCISNIWM